MPGFEELTGDIDPFTFVVSMNLRRRHLKPHEQGRILRGVAPGLSEARR
ncbi:MAG: hypothetical protein IPM29_31740 [Planctomycetes bacterium]|nr:hypothetical protein [Planctomycetota bacterium]